MNLQTHRPWHSPPTSNRHPVDELGDIRAEIKRLEERAEALREQIIDGKCSLAGDEYRARIKQQSTWRLNLNALQEHFAPEVLAQFHETKTTTMLYVENFSAPSKPRKPQQGAKR
jgi:hypothetical protein